MVQLLLSIIKTNKPWCISWLRKEDTDQMANPGGFLPTHYAFSNPELPIDRILSEFFLYGIPLDMTTSVIKEEKVYPSTQRNLFHVAAFCGHTSGIQFLIQSASQQPALLNK